MKLYHGSSQRFNSGDLLKTDKAWSVKSTIFATTHISLAVNYAISPPGHDWPQSGLMYIPYINNKTVLVSGYHTGHYVYEVVPDTFSFSCRYLDGTGDEWTSKSDVKIIKPIEITSKMLHDLGYDVRIAKGNRLFKKVIFKLAQSKIACNMHWENNEKFQKYLDLLTKKY